MYNKFFKIVIGTFAEMNCTKEAAINPFLFSVFTNNLNFRLPFLLLLYVCMYACMRACMYNYEHMYICTHMCIRTYMYI